MSILGRRLLPMTLRIIILILFATLKICAFGQRMPKSYLGRGVVHGPTYCYRVTVVEINPDSTYLRNDYGCGDKNSWKGYSKWDTETSVGRIKKWGDYYRMTEYRNKKATGGEFKLRITKRKIIFWYVNEEPKRRSKGLVLKRINSK